MPRHFLLPAIAAAGLTGAAGLAIPPSLLDSGQLSAGPTILAQSGTATTKKPPKKSQPKKTPTVTPPPAPSSPPRGSFDHGNDS